jgi:hypothetical protein
VPTTTSSVTTTTSGECLTPTTVANPACYGSMGPGGGFCAGICANGQQCKPNQTGRCECQAACVVWIVSSLLRRVVPRGEVLRSASRPHGLRRHRLRVPVAASSRRSARPVAVLFSGDVVARASTWRAILRRGQADAVAPHGGVEGIASPIARGVGGRTRSARGYAPPFAALAPPGAWWRAARVAHAGPPPTALRGQQASMRCPSCRLVAVGHT